MNMRLHSALLAAIVGCASLTGCTGSSKPQESPEMSKEQEQELGVAMALVEQELRAQRTAAEEYYTHKVTLKPGCKLVDSKVNAGLDLVIPEEVDGNCEVTYGGQYFVTVLLSELEIDPRSGFASDFSTFSLGYSARQGAELYLYDPASVSDKIALPRTDGALQIFSGDYVDLIGGEGMDSLA